MRKKFRFAIKSFLALAFGTYALACSWLFTKQDGMIFQPTYNLTETPSNYGVRFQSVRIGELSGWWVPARNFKNDGTVLLYLHGASYNLSPNAKAVSDLQKSGISVLIFDYRGYGESEGGPPSEKKVYEDAKAAWKYLVEEKKISPERIVIYGHSLGGAIAVELASQLETAKGLILESTFTSMGEVGSSRYPWIPVQFLLRHKFDSLRKISKIKMPVLLIHGTEDATVPSHMSEALHAAVQGPNKKLVLIAGGRHNNCGEVSPVTYKQAIREFLVN